MTIHKVERQDTSKQHEMQALLANNKKSTHPPISSAIQGFSRSALTISTEGDTLM